MALSSDKEQNRPEETVVLGGGLAGLSAGYELTRAGLKTVVFEADSSVGGLSKTVVSGEFRFDLGGHRFFTRDMEVENLVRELLGPELIEVCRTSKIYLRHRFFDYPLRPMNAISGMGLSTTLRILVDYLAQRVRGLAGNGRMVSLEDWVVSNFGRTMFNIYFKEYSEKVWGLDCSRISQQWVEKRIQGLSLGKAIKNAFFKFSGKEIPTLADCFLYPQLGIGRIAERLKEEILLKNRLLTGARVEEVHHEGDEVRDVVVRAGNSSYAVRGGDFLSTIPLPTLVRALRPAPPQEVLEAASSLGYRDLVIVAVMLRRERVTDQSWIYIPERSIRLGRIHEPKNWSEKMAPEGQTVLVAEYFCFKDDEIWNTPDAGLSETAVRDLEGLGFIKGDEVMDTLVLRVPKAYPLFEVGYEEHCRKIYDYLGGFGNLCLAGRAGMFKYSNMDHAMRDGMEAARQIIRKRRKG